MSEYLSRSALERLLAEFEADLPALLRRHAAGGAPDMDALMAAAAAIEDQASPEDLDHVHDRLHRLLAGVVPDVATAGGDGA